MTGSINIYGNFKGAASTGDGATINHTEVFSTKEEFRMQLMTLSERYPKAGPDELSVAAKLHMKEYAIAHPDFKLRMQKALKAGGEELVKSLIDTPWFSVPLETIKGWFSE